MANGPGGPMANMHGGLATFLTVTGPAVFALPKLSTFRVSKPPQMWTGSGWRGIEGCKRSGIGAAVQRRNSVFHAIASGRQSRESAARTSCPAGAVAPPGGSSRRGTQ